MMPDGMNHAFFTNSGSESVDSALKIALHYHRARGDASRTRLIGRERTERRGSSAPDIADIGEDLSLNVVERDEGKGAR